MPVRNRSLKPSGTLRGLEWETQPAQSAIIGLPVRYRTYRRDTVDMSEKGEGSPIKKYRYGGVV